MSDRSPQTENLILKHNSVSDSSFQAAQSFLYGGAPATRLLFHILLHSFCLGVGLVRQIRILDMFARKKAAPEFKQKFGTLATEHADMFAHLPKDVKQAYWEATITDAVTKREWQTVSKALDYEHMCGMYPATKAEEMTFQTLDGLVASILDKPDASSGVSDVDTLQACQLQLSEALSVVKVKLSENVRQIVEDVEMVVRASSEAGLAALENAYSEVISKTEEPVYRALQHGVGPQLLEACSNTVRQLSVESDALQASKTCQKFFHEAAVASEPFKAYLAEPSEPVPNFKVSLSEFSEMCGRLHKAMPLLSQSVLMEGIHAFCSFGQMLLKKASAGLTEHLNKVIPSFCGDGALVALELLNDPALDDHLRIYSAFGVGEDNVAECTAQALLSDLSCQKLLPDEFGQNLAEFLNLFELVPVAASCSHGSKGVEASHIGSMIRSMSQVQRYQSDSTKSL